jgi:hypothetical protein
MAIRLRSDHDRNRRYGTILKTLVDTDTDFDPDGEIGGSSKFPLLVDTFAITSDSKFVVAVEGGDDGTDETDGN